MSGLKHRSLKTVLLLPAIVAMLAFAAAGPAWAVEECILGALGYWHLEEDVPGTDATFADDVAGGTDGTCTGGNCPAQVTTGGQVGNFQVFGGVNDGIDIADPAMTDSVFDWSGTDSFSISVWINTAATISSNVVLVGRNPGTSVQWWVGLADPGVARFFLMDSDGQGGGISGTTAIDDDSGWHLIVAVRDGVNDQILLYVDGVLEGSIPAGTGGYTGNFMAEAVAANIGHLNGTAWYAGALDEVGLWDVALTDTQALELYDYGIAGHGYCNNTPTIDPIADIDVTENQPLPATTATGSDLDGVGDLPLTWAVTSGPALLAIDSVTGVITWTPPDDVTTGVEVVTITATDNLGGIGSLNFNINVTAVNDVPTITSAAAPTTATVGTAYTHTPAATDADGDTLAWSLIGAPADMQIVAGSGAITWTPAAGSEGDVSFTIRVSDGNGGTDDEAVTVTVAADPNTPAPAAGGGGGGGCFIATAGSESNGTTGMAMLAASLLGLAVVRFTSNKR